MRLEYLHPELLLAQYADTSVKRIVHMLPFESCFPSDCRVSKKKEESHPKFQ